MRRIRLAFVLLGGMGKKLKTGRYVEYPKYGDKGHRTVGNFYLSMLQTAGMETSETFGQLDSNLKGLDLKVAFGGADDLNRQELPDPPSESPQLD